MPGNIADILFDASGFIDPTERRSIEAELGLDRRSREQYLALDGRAAARRPRLLLRLGAAGGGGDPAAHPGHRAARRAGRCCSRSMLGVPLGVISAVRQNTALDYVLRLVSLSGLSLPSFWLGAADHDGLRPLVRLHPDLWRARRRRSGRLGDVRAAGRRGRLPQLRAHHAADPLLDAGGAAAGLHPHRALQGRAGELGQLPTTRCATRCCRW